MPGANFISQSKSVCISSIWHSEKLGCDVTYHDGCLVSDTKPHFPASIFFKILCNQKQPLSFFILIAKNSDFYGYIDQSCSFQSAKVRFSNTSYNKSYEHFLEAKFFQQFELRKVCCVRLVVSVHCQLAEKYF